MTAPAAEVEATSSILPPSPSKEDDPAEPAPRRGVIGWVKGRIQKRNIASNMNKMNQPQIVTTDEKAAVAGEPSELDIAMGLGEGGVVDDDDGAIPEDHRIDLEAENDEGLLVGWGKKLQEVEWVQKTVQVVETQVANHKEQQELAMYQEKYKTEIKEDPEIKALQRKIKKITKNLKVQRLNGDRIGKRHTFLREKEQRELDKNTARLKKAIWTFSNSSMNSHEYAKAMMRASARLQRKGVNVHKSEKALAMEAAVLRNMHRMLAIQKQYNMAKRSCNDVSSFMKRCKGWLDNKLADGEMGIMVLEATSKSMAIMYSEVVQVQEALQPKLEDPENHEFKKERMKTILALPKGLRSMPSFLKGPKQPPMRISLRKKLDDVDPNLRGYRTFKEQNKAIEKAWKEELKNYENLLEVGGHDTKIIEDDDFSDLGDSEDEIEEALAAVSVGAAAAKKAAKKEGHVDLDQMVKDQNEKEGATFGRADNSEEGEEKAAAEENPFEDAEKPAEGKAVVLDDDDTAGETLATGGGDVNAPDEKVAEDKPAEAAVPTIDQSDRSAEESAPVPEETAEEQNQADAAALEEVQKSGGDEDPEVDEAALPQEVKQEDLENLLDKEVDDAAQNTSDHADNTVEEALAEVVEDALAAVGEEDGESASDDEDEPGAAANAENRSVDSVQSTEVSV